MKRIALTAGMMIAAASFGIAEDKKAAAAEAPVEIPRSESPEGARAYIISPRNGATVGEEFVVRFGLKGMGVAPAGVDIPNTGHHHLLVDVEEYDANIPIPMNDNFRHFGGGQTEAAIKLAPGEHTLMLVLGDKLHIPHQPPVASKMITITVVEGEGPKKGGGKKKPAEEK